MGTVWPIRVLRRALTQWRINNAAHEARLCLRDVQAATKNYHTQMEYLAALHGRRKDLARAPSTDTRTTKREVPVLLAPYITPPGRRP